MIVQERANIRRIVLLTEGMRGAGNLWHTSPPPGHKPRPKSAGDWRRSA